MALTARICRTLNWTHYDAAAWTAIPWHRIAADTCPTTDVYPSHGRNVTPAAGDGIVALRGHLLAAHPTWAVDLPGAGACGLHATDNVQGRVLNRAALDGI